MKKKWHWKVYRILKIKIYFAWEIMVHGHLEPVPDMETRLTKSNAWASLAFSYFHRLLLQKESLIHFVENMKGVLKRAIRFTQF